MAAPDHQSDLLSSSPAPAPKVTQKSMGDRAFTGVGNLIKLLPTGTVFLYQFLSPVLTNYGQCSTVNKYLAGALFALCGLSCGFSSFTDSYTGSNGLTYYGVATVKGLWVFSDPNAGSTDLSKYRLQFGDLVHALFSLFVFAVVGLLDPNTVNCYYPALQSSQKALLMSLPPAVGAVSGVVFMVFPNKRHGIGYPAAVDDSTS